MDIGTFLESAGGNELFTGGLALALLGGAVRGAWSYVVQPLSRWARRRFVLEITTHSNSATFPWLTRWLSEQSYAYRSRLVTADDNWDREDNSGQWAYKPKIVPGPGLHVFLYEGRPCFLWRVRHTGQSAGAAGITEEITIRIWGGTNALAQKILKEAEEYAEGRYRGMVKIHFAQADAWRVGAARPIRPLSSLILKDGQKETLLADARTFLAAEEAYTAQGRPHRRGYLLHGPPGTGKSSAVYTLAGALGLGIYVVSLNGKDFTDDALRSLVCRVPPKNIILIEDVDAAFANRDAGDDKPRVTFKGLLNAIDGVASPEGTLLFMTTNHLDKLDPALIRGGRADLHVLLDAMDTDQARRLYQWHCPGADEATAQAWAAEHAGKVPADAQNYLQEPRSVSGV